MLHSHINKNLIVLSTGSLSTNIHLGDTHTTVSIVKIFNYFYATL